jgi:hypothetical protein
MMSESDENENQEILSPPVVEALAELPEAIAVESEGVQPSDEQAGLNALQTERLQIECDRLRDELDESKDVHALRKEYIPKLFKLILAWLVSVLVFIALTAVGWFHLSDGVLIAFITSTTVSVIGIFLIAAHWLFPKSK